METSQLSSIYSATLGLSTNFEYCSGTIRGILATHLFPDEQFWQLLLNCLAIRSIRLRKELLFPCKIMHESQAWVYYDFVYEDLLICCCFLLFVDIVVAIWLRYKSYTQKDIIFFLIFFLLLLFSFFVFSLHFLYCVTY